MQTRDRGFTPLGDKDTARNHHLVGSSLTGFTLIELIVVIAIVAILVTIVVVAINPAEQIARSRDTKRTADLDALRGAFNIYLAQTTSTINLAERTGLGCKDQVNKTYFMSSSVGTTTVPTNFTNLATSTNQQIGNISQANGTWAPARLQDNPGGAPVPALPLDPVGGGSGTYYYAYACDQGKRVYEFTARLESTYFANDLDIDGQDGGNSTSTYEVGTDLTLIPDRY